jgi:hypothetical protein
MRFSCAKHEPSLQCHHVLTVLMYSIAVVLVSAWNKKYAILNLQIYEKYKVLQKYYILLVAVQYEL